VRATLRLLTGDICLYSMGGEWRPCEHSDLGAKKPIVNMLPMLVVGQSDACGSIRTYVELRACTRGGENGIVGGTSKNIYRNHSTRTRNRVHNSDNKYNIIQLASLSFAIHNLAAINPVSD